MTIPSRRPRAPAAACAFATFFLSAGEAGAQGRKLDAVELPDVVVSTAPAGGLPTPTSLTSQPAAQVQTVIGPDRTTNTRAFSVTDLLVDSPGIALKQGNGPRDVGISIRGSNAQNGFGIRNIVIFDDGFPVTQPDGLSRSDLIDPHAYGAVDVIRGPSSALYGNYATGGAIDFRTRRGAAVDGLEVGTDVGSFGFLNNYLTYGRAVGPVEASVFASTEKGDALTSHSRFTTQTVNALLTYTLTPEDRLTFKFIENHLTANLSNRLSLAQFNQNPYQRGCAAAATGALGCQTVGLLANGYNGVRVPQSADQGGFGRNDNRAIFGARYEHDFGSNATWRTQVTLDDRNINQPTGATSAIGDYPSINAITDVTGHGTLFGLNATHYVAAFVNTLSAHSPTLNVVPGGNAALGGVLQDVTTTTTNFGVRAREELNVSDRVLLVAGIGVERTTLQGRSTAFTYAAPGLVSAATMVGTDRAILNEAPEIAAVYRPIDQLQVKGRVATGYGTPQVSNLFVTQQGLPGNNTQLKSQTNLGYDLAVAWTPTPTFNVTVDGFYEFFRNELLAQSAGPSPLMSFTFNVPRSEHRGVEVGSEWRFLPGWFLKAAFTYDNQVYTQYLEQLSAGTGAAGVTRTFDRAGNRLPGVPEQELLLRLGYDVPDGALRGLGAYVEYKPAEFILRRQCQPPARAWPTISSTPTSTTCMSSRTGRSRQWRPTSRCVTSPTRPLSPPPTTSPTRSAPMACRTAPPPWPRPQAPSMPARPGSSRRALASSSKEVSMQTMRRRRAPFRVLLAAVTGLAATGARGEGTSMGSVNMGHAPPQTCAELTLRCAATATPTIAPDGALWIAARVGNRLFVTHSSDHARSFAPAAPINTGPVTLDWGPDARPKIVVARDGTVVVAYSTFRDRAFNGEVFTTRSTDGGRTFAAVTPITDVQESQRFVEMAYDSDGGLFSAWLDKRDRVQAKAKGEPFPGAGLAYAWSGDAGKSFAPARIALDNTCECCRIAVAFAGPHQPVVLFRNIFAGGVRDHAVVTFTGRDAPGPARRVSMDDWQVDACPHHGPSLAVAADGSYHATWFTLGRARQGLFYARSGDEGAHWSEPLPLGPAGQALSRPFVLAIGSKIRLAWKAFDGEKTSLMLMRSDDGGATWDTARVIAATAKSSDHPILVNDGGHAALSWQTEEGYRLLPLDDAS